MNTVLLRCVCLLTVSIGLAQWVEAGVYGQNTPHGTFQDDSRLRSAYLQRVTRLQFAAPSASSQERVQKLQRHFDAVLELLEANSEQSLAAALDRLESRRGETWTEAVRRQWRQELVHARQTNVRRLERYRDAGRFPINQHAATHAVPVFVDNYDTACAVGHLMRESGWEEEVAGIQAGNNLVYVTDVSEGPLVDWVATSGLTQGEAALIQPGYEVYPGAIGEVEFGGSVPAEFNGIIYSNFRTSEVSNSIEWAAEDLYFAHPNPFLLQEKTPSLNEMEAKIRYGGGASDLGYPYQPYYDRWLTVGELPIQLYQNEYMFYGYEFTLTAAGSARIDAITILSNIVASYGWVLGGQCVVGLEAFDANGVQLGEVLYDLESPGGITGGRSVLPISPQKQVRVRVSLFAIDGVDIRRFGHEFNLVNVPEPSSAAMLLPLGCVAMRRRRSNKQLLRQTLQPTSLIL